MLCLKFFQPLEIILIQRIIMSDYSEQSSQYSEEESEVSLEDKPKKKKAIVQSCNKLPAAHARITINLALTHYDVIEDVAEELDWKVTRKLKSKHPWDVLWTDHHIQPDLLIKLQLYQKVSHFPGIHVLSRKNLLGLSFMDMYRRAPDQYNFFPKTWLLPAQYSELRKEFATEDKTFIVKPQADCQGRGIFLTQKIEEVGNGGHYVVQEYISRPFLIDGLKFDFRVYVLLCGISPLRLYVYEEGLARFATEPYVEPNKNNLKKQYIHLTNYAINKKNPKFIFNSSSQRMDVGHKRALTSVLKIIQKKGFSLTKLQAEINDAIVKTLILGHPLAAHQYRFCQPHDENRNMCFHILGIDIMLDADCKPYVLEVNHTPSFVADTPLDRFIKFSLIKDTLQLLNITPESRGKAIEKMNRIQREKNLGRQKRQLYQNLDKQQRVKIAQEQRTAYENCNMGRYTRIFPPEEEQKRLMYEELLEIAEKSYFSENNVLRAQMEKEKAQEQSSTTKDKQKEKELQKQQKGKKAPFFESYSTIIPSPNPPKLRKIVSSNDNTIRESDCQSDIKLSPFKRQRLGSYTENSRKKPKGMDIRELDKFKEIEKQLTPFKPQGQMKPTRSFIKKSPSINNKSINPKILPKIGHEAVSNLISPLKKDQSQHSPYRNRKIRTIKIMEDDRTEQGKLERPVISIRSGMAKSGRKGAEDEQQSDEDD